LIKLTDPDDFKGRSAGKLPNQNSVLLLIRSGFENTSGAHLKIPFPLPLQGERSGEGVSDQQITPSPRPSPSRERESLDGRESRIHLHAEGGNNHAHSDNRPMEKGMTVFLRIDHSEGVHGTLKGRFTAIKKVAKEV
jgi:hypothetical protein